MSGNIKIRKADGVYSIRSGGAVLGESANALELSEDGKAPVLYFPRGDVAMAFLERTDKITHCPKKGAAAHFSIINRSAVIESGAWSYEEPLEGVSEIKEYIAFYPHSDVQVERI